MIDYNVKVSAEWESGLYVSKDVIAEEMYQNFDGETVESGNASGTITGFVYEGSKQGQPLTFSISVEWDEEGNDDERLEALTELLDGQDVSCQHDNSDMPTNYTLTVEDVIENG